jgi:hypothetical protein
LTKHRARYTSALQCSAVQKASVQRCSLAAKTLLLLVLDAMDQHTDGPTDSGYVPADWHA